MTGGVVPVPEASVAPVPGLSADDLLRVHVSLGALTPARPDALKVRNSRSATPLVPGSATQAWLGESPRNRTRLRKGSAITALPGSWRPARLRAARAERGPDCCRAALPGARVASTRVPRCVI
jgi:hypothetical protein